MSAYEIVRQKDQLQETDGFSYIGGLPTLPTNLEIPKCKICGSPLTFFFQLQFSHKHFWQDKVLSLFACTQSSNQECQMLKLPKSLTPDVPYIIPDGFLDYYQDNIRILVFDKVEVLQMRTDYTPILRYERLGFQTTRPTSRKTKVGGVPKWRTSNDTPLSYEGKDMKFLLQIESGWQFEKLENAPFQAKVDWLGGGYWEIDTYDLFAGTALYFFGTTDSDASDVFVINQR
jgi:hypothetical protein